MYTRTVHFISPSAFLLVINKDILMLSKVCKNLFSTGANVWVNKHTKVICQGMTGNQVPPHLPRAPSKHSRHLTITPKWSVASTPKKQDKPTSDYPSLKTAPKPKKLPAATLPSSTFLPQAQPMPSSKHYKQNLTFASSSLMVLKQ